MKQLPDTKVSSLNKEMFLLLKWLQLKLNKNPTESTNPESPRLWTQFKGRRLQQQQKSRSWAVEKSRTEEKRRGGVSWSDAAISHFLHKVWGSKAGWHRLPCFSPLVPLLGLIHLFKTSATFSRTNWDVRRWLGCKFRDPGFKQWSLLTENRWGRGEKNKEIKGENYLKILKLGGKLGKEWQLRFRRNCCWYQGLD